MIRQKKKHYNALLVLTSMLIYLFCGGSVLLSQDNLIDGVIGIAGNKMVLLSEVEQAYLQEKAQNPAYDEDLKCTIFENIMVQKLYLNQAALDTIEATETQVNQQVEARINFFISQIGDKKKMEKYFKKDLFAIKEDLSKTIEEQIIAEKVQREITQDINVTPFEVKKYFNNLKEGDKELIPEKYEIEQLVVKPRVDSKKKSESLEKLRQYRERIVNGEKFSTLAILYSEDLNSAKKGGELGYVNRADLVSQFANVAFGLKNDKISRIVETEFGFHIMQLIDRKGSKINVRHILVKPEISSEDIAKAKQVMDTILYNIKNDSISWKNAVLWYSDDKDTKINGGLIINPIDQTSKFPFNQIEYPSVRQEIKKLKVNEITDPFLVQDETGAQTYRIIRLKSLLPEHKINPKEDYNLIKEMLMTDRQQKAIDQWVYEKQKETFIKVENRFKQCKFKYSHWND